jgi:hypothetical protein
MGNTSYFNILKNDKQMKKKVGIIMISSILYSGFSAPILAQNKSNAVVTISEDQLDETGLMGYISSDAPQPAAGFDKQALRSERP